MVLNKCCLCFGLRLGCTIIAYLQILGSIVFIFDSALTLLTDRDLYDLVTALMSGMNSKANHFTGPVNYYDTRPGTLLNISAGIQLGISILLLMFANALLVGLKKNRKAYLMTYLVYLVFFLVLFFIQFMLKIAVGKSDLHTIAVNTLYLVFNIYFFYVIKSKHYWMVDMSPSSHSTARRSLPAQPANTGPTTNPANASPTNKPASTSTADNPASISTPVKPASTNTPVKPASTSPIAELDNTRPPPPDYASALASTVFTSPPVPFSYTNPPAQLAFTSPVTQIVYIKTPQ